MEISKHKNHRNARYLNWLRTRKCVVSGQTAECAHHIRLGTNGGTGIKPSDYFCIPLLNEYHVSGPAALHIIGEETFLAQFGLDPKELFIKFMKEYLIETFEIYYMLEGRTQDETIADLIGLIENKLPKLDKVSKKPKKKKKPTEEKVATPSVTETEFYQKAKELKRERDRELRQKLSFKGNEVYEKAKELKRQRDKELRKKLKVNSPKATVSSFKGNEYYEKAKELKRQRDKEMRKKLKERAKETQC